ncbi:hypothetical protein Mapa_012669 [Marchantia paleacea]|nr:hypothetical protein Mapa_012669 [Marchantia paleacea]
MGKVEDSQSVQSEPESESSLFVLSSDLVVDSSYFSFKDDSPKAQMEQAQAANSAFRYANEDFSDLEELQVLRLEGIDRQGRRVVRIVGKYLPATAIDRERLKIYITNKLANEIKDDKFSIVYFHSKVDRAENSPGMLYMRQIYESLSQALRQQLAAIYVVHPGLKSRLLLATVGRFFLSEGFYQKVVYISRVEFLVDHVKKGQVEVPEFVVQHDEDLENRPLMDYGLETDPNTYLDAPGMNATTRILGRTAYY